MEVTVNTISILLFSLAAACILVAYLVQRQRPK